MAIHVPGVKFRHSRILSRHQTKRNVVVVLSLTAMVDMFTVLVIFLLQNYNVTGEVLFLPKQVQLPKAEKVKDLEASVAVTVGPDEIFVDKDPVVETALVRQQPEWLITPLQESVKAALENAKIKFENRIEQKLSKLVTRPTEKVPDKAILPYQRVTVQADKNIDFLTIKKVLFSVTEAGAKQINFAVLKGKDE